MLTMRQWLAIAINIIAGNLILAFMGFDNSDARSGNLHFCLLLSALAVALFFLAFKLLPWGASWLVIVPTALLTSVSVPTLALASIHLETPFEAVVAGFLMTIIGAVQVAPMFVLNSLLLRWGTRERRTNR